MTTPPTFADLMATASAADGRFGHRAHVHLTWLAIRQATLATAAARTGWVEPDLAPFPT